MGRDEIDWRAGEVAYWGMDDLDATAPLAGQRRELREDLAQVAYGRGVVIDVGWYPAGSMEGGFAVLVVRDRDWERPLSDQRCASVDALRACLRRAVEIAAAAAGGEAP